MKKLRMKEYLSPEERAREQRKEVFKESGIRTTEQRTGRKEKLRKGIEKAKETYQRGARRYARAMEYGRKFGERLEKAKRTTRAEFRTAKRVIRAAGPSELEKSIIGFDVFGSAPRKQKKARRKTRYARVKTKRGLLDDTII